MIDWSQFARNLLYGAVHRPAQVLYWMGGRFSNEAAPLGRELQSLAQQVDSKALSELQPTFATSPPSTGATGGLSSTPPNAAEWVKPSGPLYPFLSCPTGYTLIRVSPVLEVPGYSCRINGSNDLKAPPLALWAF